MKPYACEFEPEVSAAVVHSAWPHGVDEALRAHILSCEMCSEAAAVAGSLAAVREADGRAEIPSSGLVWWRAQMRMRREAAAAAERPMIAVQWIAFVCAATLLVSWIASSWVGLNFAALFMQHELLIVIIAALVFGIPAAVYLALGKE